MKSSGESETLGRWVHLTLLGGVVVSGLLMGVGLIVALALGQPRPEGEPPALGSLLRRAARADGLGWMDFGLLILMATPVLRVGVLALAWGIERNWRFLAVALVVLGLLGVSVALGVA